MTTKRRANGLTINWRRTNRGGWKLHALKPKRARWRLPPKRRNISVSGRSRGSSAADGGRGEVRTHPIAAFPRRWHITVEPKNGLPVLGSKIILKPIDTAAPRNGDRYLGGTRTRVLLRRIAFQSLILDSGHVLNQLTRKLRSFASHAQE